MKESIVKHNMGNKIEIPVFPKRIIKTVGDVQGAENLLTETPLIVTFNAQNFAVMKKKTGERTYLVLDFGKELHGGVRLIVPTIQKKDMKPVRVRLTFGESVSEALAEVDKDSSTNDHSPRDFEVLLSHISALEFGQTGFRFLKIELLEDDTTVTLKAVAGILRLQDVERKGYFQSNDALFDEIVETAIYTAQVNMQDGVVWDGIKRDRLVWCGDLNTELLTIAYAFGDLTNVKNSLRILKDSTPVTTWMNHISTYSAWFIVNLFDYYIYTGDIAFVKENLDYANQILADFDACISEDGVMDFGKTGKNKGMEFFLDWPSYETPDAVIGTAALLRYTMLKAEAASMDGIDYNCVGRIKEKLKKYGEEKATLKQTVAMQEVSGMKPIDALNRLEKDGAHGFTTFMSYFLLKALAQVGSEKTLEMAKSYYGGMLSRGATTFWEDFDLDWLEGSGRIDEEPKAGEKDLHADYGNYCYKGLRHSFCHGWASGVVGYTFEEIVGIEVLSPGYKKVRISPKLNGLKHFKATVPTPYGNIEVSADESGAKISVPTGVELVK